MSSISSFYSMSSIASKHLLNKSNVSIFKYGYKYLRASSALANSISDNIQVANHLKPLISRPVNEVLSSVDTSLTTPSESVSFLKALRMHKQFNNVAPETFKSDVRFKYLCTVFQKSCDGLDYSLLISGLRSLLEVGMAADSPSVIAAEKRILMNSHKFNTVYLIRCLHFHHKFVQSDLQKQVVTKLQQELTKQLSEVSTPAEVMLLCQILNLFTETDQKKIELKIVELVPLLSIHEMCKVIILLSQKSVRNIAILNAIAFHIRQTKEVLSVKDVVDILYACKKLNYSDPRFFSYLSQTALVEIPAVTQPSIISGLLTTCGHLRWKHIELLDACTDWMKTNLDICRTRELSAFILTSACLNYSTSKARSLLELIIPSAISSVAEYPNVLLDIAWSLEVLNMLSKKLLLQVLSPEFYKPLLKDDQFQAQTSDKLKLLNLKGVLKIRYPEHVFGCNLYLEPIKLAESAEVQNSRRHVINVLSNFVPKQKCMSANQCNDMGIFIDAEFIMDQNVKPLPIAEYGLLATTTKSKALMKGAKRIALLVMFHKDYTLRSKTLTGVNALAVKLLTNLGYFVLQISYDEFLRNKTEVEKAKYLMQKIKLLVQSSDISL